MKRTKKSGHLSIVEKALGESKVYMKYRQKSFKNGCDDLSFNTDE